MNLAGGWRSLEAASVDDAAVRIDWLERALVGLDLSTVISELAAIAGKPATSSDGSPESVRFWLGSDAAAVMRKGLGGLPARKVDDLFRNPALLAGLQELVLAEGSAHWDDRLRGDDVIRKLAARQRHAIAVGLGIDRTMVKDEVAEASKRTGGAAWPRVNAVSGDGRTRLHRSISSAWPLTQAAAVLVAVTAVWLLWNPSKREVPTESVAVVKVVVPEATTVPDEPGRPDFGEGGGETWPEHPWKTMVGSTSGGKARRLETKVTGLAVSGRTLDAVPTDKLLTESRHWSREFQGARHLTSNQVRIAAERARGGIMAVDALASEGGLDRGDDFGTRLRAKCRIAVEELDHVHALLDGKSPDDADLARARQDILRVLRAVEAALVTDADESAPAAASAP